MRDDALYFDTCKKPVRCVVKSFMIGPLSSAMSREPVRPTRMIRHHQALEHLLGGGMIGRRGRGPPSKHDRPLEETQEFVSRMKVARREAEIVAEVMRQFRGSGADHILAAVLPIQAISSRDLLDYVLLSSWPAEWCQRYLDRDYWNHDPVKHLVEMGKTAFFWSETDTRRLDDVVARSIMDAAAGFGLKEFYTVVFPSLDGASIVFSISGARLDLDHRAQRVVGLIGICAISSVLRLRHSGELRYVSGISRREQETIQLVADGLNERAIAERMDITLHGVEKHLKSIREKLGARNSVQAVAELLRLGVIT